MRSIWTYEKIGRVASTRFLPSQPATNSTKDTLSTTSVSVPPESVLRRLKGSLPSSSLSVGRRATSATATVLGTKRPRNVHSSSSSVTSQTVSSAGISSGEVDIDRDDEDDQEANPPSKKVQNEPRQQEELENIYFSYDNYFRPDSSSPSKADGQVENDQRDDRTLLLPDSDLLKAIHSYASDFYTAAAATRTSTTSTTTTTTFQKSPSETYRFHRRKKKGEEGKKGQRAVSYGYYQTLDETALMALGILLDETAAEILGDNGDLVFVEGEEVASVDDGGRVEQHGDDDDGGDDDRGGDDDVVDEGDEYDDDDDDVVDGGDEYVGNDVEKENIEVDESMETQ